MGNLSVPPYAVGLWKLTRAFPLGGDAIL
jgi:hypothetical protein